MGAGKSESASYQMSELWRVIDKGKRRVVDKGKRQVSDKGERWVMK